MKLTVIVLVCAGALALAADPVPGNHQLAESILLFGDAATPPLILDSSRGWVPVTTFKWDGASAVRQDGNRRWRLKTSYEHDGATGPVTIQIRIRANGAAPVFTHPWFEGSDRRTESYSNWFVDSEGRVGSSERSTVEVRLIAPPRAPFTGKLHAVLIEAWEREGGAEPSADAPAAPQVHLAYARPLPNTRVRQPDMDPQEALSFSLQFVEACITGDLAAYYRAQADSVFILDEGRTMAKYRRSPPAELPGVQNLDDYTERFDYQIYDADTFRALFPEWFDSQRSWTPGDNSWLFMGHRDRQSDILPRDVDYLIFVVAVDEAGRWRVVARPKN